ncbi:uncharacterized protein [Cicer arietinum]|uniref:Uncharacterized protein LOC101492704 n=1 Tax=Cicer arietinum TaxID=3827 RepID=A0A1S2YT75_CICAR|nr:uncharacterized protein LOC101492704 [Cicer arietinum]XP_004509521.1 uncharacterized protein LOC101492704 [Cicer arietinum]
MGSNSSRPTSSTSKGLRGFHSYCLGSCSGSHGTDNQQHQVCDQNKVNGSDVTYADGNLSDSNEMKTKSFRKVKTKYSDITCMSKINLDEWSETRIPNTSSRSGTSTVHASSTHSLNPTRRFLSRFGIIPSNINFRLNRFTSSRSSRSRPVTSASLSIFDNDVEHNLHQEPCSSLINRNETRWCSSLLPASFVNQIPTECHEDTPNSSNPTSGFGARDELDVSLFSSRTRADTENIETRHIDRQTGAREPVEPNARFSRTLSVGRLRDRVLRRSTLSDLTFFPLQQERELRDANQNVANSRMSPSDHSVVSSSSMSNSMFSIQNYDVETSRSRDGRYQDLLEHRSNFLERRRRLRSQVRSLQRLGSRFENHSAHERSCILSDRHRSGRCTCRFINRDTNSNDDTGARASISRIVILAEALFEVLDEIHLQSVVLPSHPSVSSIGSVPAPISVVDSLPLKLYDKLLKDQEDATECYICLVEYEDGDSVRVLPCHHEFHRTCIDKWLKEIHSVCPLCRRNICILDATPTQN